MKLSQAASRLQGRLKGMDAVFSGCSTDSRSVNDGELFIALRGIHFDGHDFIGAAFEKGASAAMVEQIPDERLQPVLAVDNTRLAMGRLAGHWRAEFDITLVAVTGSNGKTTVKEMIASILKLKAPVLSTRGNLNNDIGVPLTLFGLSAEHRYAVIEMGANHPGEIAGLSKLARPTIAVITQCAPAHLQGFGSVEGVAKAKAEIFSGMEENGIAVINADDKYAGLWENAAIHCRKISFSTKKKADFEAKNIVFDPGSGRTEFLLSTPEGSTEIRLLLAGEHNVANALAATACCMAAGIPLELVKSGLESLSYVNGRLRMLRTSQGVRIFDDTYNANPASLNAGLDVLSKYPGRKWLVLGEMGELGDQSVQMHRQAGISARQYGVEKLFATGEHGRYAAEGFGEGGRYFETLEELHESLGKNLEPDVTLLVKGSRHMAMNVLIDRLTAGG